MKGKRGFIFLIATMLLVFIIMSHSRTEAGMKGCYRLYISECLKNGDLDYKNWDSVIISLQSNGDLREPNQNNTAGMKTGVWFLWGGSFFIHLLVDHGVETCTPLFSGSKKQGFYECTAIPAPNLTYPGCWYLEKLKIKIPKSGTPEDILKANCPWFYAYEGLELKADYDTNAVIDLDDEDDD